MYNRNNSGPILITVLGMGTMLDCFHIVGKQPVEIDLLKSLVTKVAMLAAVAFNILPEI